MATKKRVIKKKPKPVTKPKKKPVRKRKDGKVDGRSIRDKSTYHSLEPAPKGNKYAKGNSGRPAVVWTEANAIKLGNDLIDWMRLENTNIFWQEYLVIERDLYADIINDLRSKFAEFDRLMKKADEIQQTKIIKWASVNKLNPSVSIFVLKTKHGMKEINGLEHSGTIKTLADIAHEASKGNE